MARLVRFGEFVGPGEKLTAAYLETKLPSGWVVICNKELVAPDELSQRDRLRHRRSERRVRPRGEALVRRYRWRRAAMVCAFRTGSQSDLGQPCSGAQARMLQSNTPGLSEFHHRGLHFREGPSSTRASNSWWTSLEWRVMCCIWSVVRSSSSELTAPNLRSSRSSRSGTESFKFLRGCVRAQPSRVEIGNYDVIESRGRSGPIPNPPGQTRRWRLSTRLLHDRAARDRGHGAWR